jgi:ribonuclease Z
VRFDVTVLGCGAATPTLRYQPTAQVLNIAEKWFLLDAGEGVQKSLRAQRVPFQKIERVFISHMHGDHVLGLPGLIGSMNLLGRIKPLGIHGPANLERWLMEGLRLTETHLNFKLEFKGNNPNSVRTSWAGGPVDVVSAPVNHRVEAYGYRFNWRATSRNIKKDAIQSLELKRSEIIKLKRGEDVKRVNSQSILVSDVCLPQAPNVSYVYSGDTSPCSNLDALAQDANLLYHEATFADSLKAKAKQTGHSTASQAATTAKNASVSKLLLGHFSSRYRSLDILIEEASQTFLEVELAQEGRCYSVQSYV